MPEIHQVDYPRVIPRLLGCSGEEGPSPSRAVLHGVEHMVWRLTPGSYQLLTRDVVYA